MHTYTIQQLTALYGISITRIDSLKIGKLRELVNNPKRKMTDIQLSSNVNVNVNVNVNSPSTINASMQKELVRIPSVSPPITPTSPDVPDIALDSQHGEYAE